MKALKHLLGASLALTLTATACFSASAATVEYRVKQDFTGYAAGATDYYYRWEDGAAVKMDLVDSPATGIPKAAKMTPGAKNGTQVGFMIGLPFAEVGIEGAQGIRLWMKNTSMLLDEYIFNISIVSETDSWRGTEKGIQYTLNPTGGTAETVKDGGGGVRIPQGFEGYVDFAIDQFEQGDTSKTTSTPVLSEIKAFQISGDINNVKDQSLLIGNIQYYGTDLPAAGSGSTTTNTAAPTQKSGEGSNVDTGSAIPFLPIASVAAVALLVGAITLARKGKATA